MAITPKPDPLRFFAFDHLPPHLQDVSRAVRKAAVFMQLHLPESAEKSAGLRKLLEAKDCFVRAAIDLRQEREEQATTAAVVIASGSEGGDHD